MNITRYAHSCLLVEVKEVSVLTDPGSWNKTPQVEKLDAILITHEHPDHFDIGQIQELLAKHPSARVITHEAVGKMLGEAGVKYELIEDGGVVDVNGVSVKSFGDKHAVVYGSSPCRNTGYLINGELFAPGDALHDVPPVGVRILALPTGGPWMKMAEAIDYAKSVKPQVAFPIHDAMYTEEYRDGLVPRIVGGNLESAGITFVNLAPGGSQEF